MQLNHDFSSPVRLRLYVANFPLSRHASWTLNPSRFNCWYYIRHIFFLLRTGHGPSNRRITPRRSPLLAWPTENTDSEPPPSVSVPFLPLLACRVSFQVVRTVLWSCDCGSYRCNRTSCVRTICEFRLSRQM